MLNVVSSAIISAIGGSLGLFLGFSCWECFKSSMRHLEDFVWPRYGHKTSSNNSRLMRQQKKVMLRKSNKDDPSQPPKFKQPQSFVDVQIT